MLRVWALKRLGGMVNVPVTEPKEARPLTVNDLQSLVNLYGTCPALGVVLKNRIEAIEKKESMLNPTESDDRARLVFNTKRSVYREILGIHAEAAGIIEKGFSGGPSVSYTIGNLGKTEVNHG
jgi:hypothetical protein